MTDGNVVEVSQEIYDRITTHAIDLRRYTSGTVREVLDLLDQADRELVTRIREVEDGTARKRALTERLAILRETSRKVRDNLTEAIRDHVGEVARSTQRTVVAALKKGALDMGLEVALDALSPQQLVAAAVSRPLDGRHLEDWVKGLEESRRERVQRQLQLGYVQGDSIEDVVRRIRGTRARGYRDGVLQMSHRSATALVRTATTHSENVAIQEVGKRAAEKGLIRGMRWSSVLDGRTTPICRARDQEVYPVKEGPRPPAHINCRSRMTYVLADEGDEDTYRESYGEWLARQPEETQDDILGPARARLFREGKEDVKSFVDDDGRLLTLDELRERRRRRNQGLDEADLGPDEPDSDGEVEQRPAGRYTGLDPLEAPARPEGRPYGPSEPYEGRPYGPPSEMFVEAHALGWRDKYFKPPSGKLSRITKQDVKDYLDKMVGKAEVWSRTRAATLKKILQDGRFKTQFETGTSGGALNNMVRENLERHFFGYPNDLDPKRRPVYGYLSGPGEDGEGSGYTLPMYGNVRVKLRRDRVEKRTTFTVADSLDRNPAAGIDEAQIERDFPKAGDLSMFMNTVPQPIDRPDIQAVPSRETEMNSLFGYNMSEDDEFRYITGDYWEAQIHGGVTVEDIEEVVFKRNNYPDAELERALEENGIEWRVVE